MSGQETVGLAARKTACSAAVILEMGSECKLLPQSYFKFVGGAI